MGIFPHLNWNVALNWGLLAFRREPHYWFSSVSSLPTANLETVQAPESYEPIPYYQLLYTYICTHILLVLLRRIILANAVIEKSIPKFSFWIKGDFQKDLSILRNSSVTTPPVKDVTKSHSWRDLRLSQPLLGNNNHYCHSLVTLLCPIRGKPYYRTVLRVIKHPVRPSLGSLPENDARLKITMWSWKKQLYHNLKELMVISTLIGMGLSQVLGN